MKTHSTAIVVLAACSALVLAAVPAFAQNNRVYSRGDLGGQVIQDTKLREFFGEALAPDTKVVFDPGIRIGFAAGFRITDWFSVEGESGIMANNIKSITDANSVEATLVNIPFMLNTRFECPGKRCIVAPYFGGGLGVSSSIVDADHIDIGSTVMSGTVTTAVFAYQAFGGIRFRLNDRMGISLEYHYFATTDSSWDVDATAGTTSNRMKFGGTQTHAASIAIDARF